MQYADNYKENSNISDKFIHLEHMIVSSQKLAHSTIVRGFKVTNLQQKETNIRIDRLEEDVSVLKEDVAVLKEDVSVLKEDMKEVKTKINSIDNKLDRIFDFLQSGANIKSA